MRQRPLVAVALGLFAALASVSCRRELSPAEKAHQVDVEERAARAEARAAAAEARAQALDAELRALQEHENHECGRARAEVQLLRAMLAKDGGAPAAPRGPKSGRCAPGDPLCD